MSDILSPAGAGRRGVPSWLVLALVLVAIAAFPIVVQSGFRVFLATQIGCYLLVAMGLNLLTGYSGQTSLGHGALVAMGAYVVAICTTTYGWSFWPAMVAAVVLIGAWGAIMALPALRVSSWYLALLTFGFAGVTHAMLIEWAGLTGGYQGIINIPMPRIGDYVFGPTELFWLVAALNVACFIALKRLLGARFGRGLIAVRDNPLGAVASGVPIARIKMWAFVVSAALAGLAGALLAVQKQVVTPDEFGPEFSIFFLLVVVLGGGGSLWGPVIGTAVFFALPELMTALAQWRMLIYGLLLLVLMIYAPHGLEGALRGLINRIWSSARSVRPQPANANASAAIARSSPAEKLVIRGLVKRFGGVSAADGIDLEVPAGSCHAIVGPNGSGKTTLLNLISGYYIADEGRITLGDRELAGRKAAQLVSEGIGRTFQTPKLLPDMTVLENVLLGAFPDEKSSAAAIALSTPAARREADQLRARARDLLAFVGLGAQEEHLAGNIPHGQQRLIEIARALMARPQLLLLDEPAAGLSLEELDRLGELVRAIHASGITQIIVEHHLDLVGALADRVTVIDRGRVLSEGRATEVFADPRVVAAYMGTQPVALPPASEAISS